MTGGPRICVYFSKGRNCLEVLRRIKEHEPDARICAMVPKGYPFSEDEKALADEVVETELPHYSPRNVAACLRLVRQIRAAQYDAFVIMFDSVQLRILSALAGARRRIHCTMDGRLVPVTASIPGVMADVAARAIWGRLVYIGIWLAVRLLPVRGIGDRSGLPDANDTEPKGA